jgi:hypothetical protein
MRTHILTALMALFLAACASQRDRDVASVKDQEAMESTSGQSEQAALDGVSSRGDHIK